jgi:hypothetical protein
MNWMLALQIMTGAFWCGPAWLLSKGSWRIMRGRGAAVDAARMPWFFTAVVQVGFSSRWLFWHHAIATMDTGELVYWATWYSLSAMCAVGAMLVFHQADKLLR